MYKKRKTLRIALFLVFLLCAVTMVGCGQQTPAETPAETPSQPEEGPDTTDVATQDPVNMQLFTGMTAGHYYCGEVLPFFIDEVEARTDGLVTVDFYPGGELYGYMDGIDALVNGIVNMGLTSAGQWGGYNPVLTFSDYFFMIEDNDHWFRARDEVDHILNSIFEEQNAKVLFYPAYGGNVIASRHPIDNLGDLAGRSIRAPVPGALDSVSKLGGVPSHIAAGEVYDALDKGAIDAAVVAWEGAVARGQHEVTEYFIGPVWWTVWNVIVSLDTWEKLTPETQEIIMEVAMEAEDKALEISRKADETNIKDLQELVNVRQLEAEEIDEWRNTVMPAYQEWIEKCADEGYGEEAQQIFDILNKHR